MHVAEKILKIRQRGPEILGFQLTLILYVDFKKAFDCIHRSTMNRIMKAYSTPPILLAVIEQMYENTRANVISPDRDTDFF